MNCDERTRRAARGRSCRSPTIIGDSRGIFTSATRCARIGAVLTRDCRALVARRFARRTRQRTAARGRRGRIDDSRPRPFVIAFVRLNRHVAVVHARA